MLLEEVLTQSLINCCDFTDFFNADKYFFELIEVAIE